MLLFTQFASFALFAAVCGQQFGTLIAEMHPRLPIQQCTSGRGCTMLNTSVTLDANWRFLHPTNGYTECFVGNAWNSTVCSDPISCARNCALDGTDYAYSNGITTSGNAITMKLNGATPGLVGVGSRVFLMLNDVTYRTFQLKNQLLSFDVDISKLPCGLAGAVTLNEMATDGGMSQFPGNRAGAKYGTGYCGGKCPQDLKFINGEANLLAWTPTSPTSGIGQYGSCCNEVDVWHANSAATVLTAHPCSAGGQTRCQGGQCGSWNNSASNAVCDWDGCDFNPYRLDNTTFFGSTMTLDTSKKFTVVTQFVTSTNTTAGDLMEIRRYYVQNGVVIQNAVTNIPIIVPTNEIDSGFCKQQKVAFQNTDFFATLGGLKTVGDALGRGMVLALSLRDDPFYNMTWLDGIWPPGSPPKAPGAVRGPCPLIPTQAGAPQATPSVVFSNIKFGDVGSLGVAPGL